MIKAEEDRSIYWVAENVLEKKMRLDIHADSDGRLHTHYRKIIGFVLMSLAVYISR